MGAHNSSWLLRINTLRSFGSSSSCFISSLTVMLLIFHVTSKLSQETPDKSAVVVTLKLVKRIPFFWVVLQSFLFPVKNLDTLFDTRLKAFLNIIHCITLKIELIEPV